MTIEEREKKLKETMPAAVVAITDVLNSWAEVTTIEGDEEVVDPNKNLEIATENAKRLEGTLCLIALASGLNIGEFCIPILILSRQMLQLSSEAPAGALDKKPWEQ